MNHRPYDPERDKDAVHRIWHETGWLEKGKEHMMDRELEAGRAIVADLNGSPECLVISSPGSVRYLHEELPFWCITGVTTSRIARKQRLASRLTAAAIAEAVGEGALVVGLGMFEQGYYNRLGFGTGTYSRTLKCDPAHLGVSVEPRVPRRLTTDDWELIHAGRLARRRVHGGSLLFPGTITRAAINDDDGFGLGYCDGPAGELTHHFWCYAKDRGSGPYSVSWLAFQTREQFLELMAVIKSLGDQVRLVKIPEPPDIQLQDLLVSPFREFRAREGAKFEVGWDSVAWWQMRICDLPGCLAQTHLPWGEVWFNLQLTDPIERFLDEGAPWRGTTGDYVVALGPESSARPGADPGLPTLTASVGAFTRLWLGVRPASGLAITDDLSGPKELLESLDETLRLPPPQPDWSF
jgi:hypothetical protein